MILYADTSLLVSYYVSDANSVRAQTLLHATTDPLIFTGLHRLELRNALALGVFRQILTPAQAYAAWSNITQDIRSRRLFPQPVNWAPVFRTAAQWAARHSGGIGCRTLDILHVATAWKLQAREFLSFDGRQRTLAQQLRFTVKP
ncbi:MAG: type II toxin-antitoxin system VapC family toxin [Verrucomicrobia bacterium]|nr:type II toxin-antitoxin system VapC family toxin [Verrucomicrobiota bacterium]